MVSRTAQNSTIEAATRELDSRTTSDGIHVQLVWHPREERVTVVVEDTKIGEAFELAVGPGQRALDVFRHPYAYAAAEMLAGAWKQDALPAVDVAE